MTEAVNNYQENPAFVHLHIHTEYSLLDGACRIEKLMQRVKALGQTAVAITDHGAMYGCVDFYKAAKKAGIKPIIGCEVYMANRSRFDKVYKLDTSNHLVLLCENETGYKNLIKLVSAGFVEGFYSKPRIDRELLEKYHEGLICLSACLAGEIPQALLAGNWGQAVATAAYYKELFGPEHFYIELQDHGIEEQQRVLPELIRLARQLDIPMVATNDAHYLTREDSKMQRILVCISTNKTINDPDRLEFGTDEFYVKSTEEMYELFSLVPEACANTARVAQLCNFDFEFGNTKLPYFCAPDGRDNKEYFIDLCYTGLYKRYGEKVPQAYRERLDYEISVIERMGYINYYLIVFDFINYARSQGIPVGPGRGSGAGSIAAYCIGITGIDPMKYNLLFERFLNPERVSMPDFDIDFCFERRQEVIDYVVRKYGADHVAQIITFGTMAARQAIRDVGRVLDMSYQAVDKVAKLVPTELKMTLEKALKASPELAQLYREDPQVKELLDLAIKVEGMPRHASTHAAGVVITREAAQEYVPLSCTDGQIITQFTMTTIEELGLLKMDFLGLRTLTVIHDAECMIRQNTDAAFSIDAASMEDETVFRMLSAGDTCGTFQFESSGMRQVLMGLKPRDVEDLIAVISLYRPGPMDSIPTYIRNRHNPALISYSTEKLRPILDVTNGCIVYQEQVMQICRELAGYSFGQADLVRRAMAKKKHEVMEKERERFLHGSTQEGDSCCGCVNNGIPEEVANQIYDSMISFASYAFNKSHAAAYAFVAYQTAYLKCHHTREFMAALLTSVLGFTDKIIEYTGECQRLGIKVLPPDINTSGLGFTVEGDCLRFGLLALKNVGRNLIESTVRERQERPFASLYDFCKRLRGTELNRRAVESFIKAGAFDRLEPNRHRLIQALESVLKSVENDSRRNIAGQLSLFDMMGEAVGQQAAENDFIMPEAPEYSVMEKLQMEKEISGLYLSGHPLDAYRESIARVDTHTVSQITGEEGKALDGSFVCLMAIIVKFRYLTTKSDATMAFLTVEDLTGSMEVVVFPKVLHSCMEAITENAVVVLSGRVSVREDEPAKLLADNIQAAAQQNTAEPARQTKQQKLYIKVPDTAGELFARVCNLLEIFAGSVPVTVYSQTTGKYMLAPKKLWVEPTKLLMEELEGLLGRENVVLK